MNGFRKILAQIFAGVAYAVLGLAGWKKTTVETNLRHVSQEPRGLYKKMLKNLTRHVGELLFCFDTYKNLPEDCAAYPCGASGCSFELAAGTEAVIEKMRKGGIFLTAHYGNYEASGAWLCALGVPLKASFIPLKPEWLNRHIYNKVRCVRGRPYSVDAKTPRDFLRILDGTAPDCAGQKQLFCLLADQDSRIPSALDGTFLEQPAKINPLPDFLLKHRPDTPVFFCWIEERSGQKILHAVEAATYQPDYNNWLEARIKENPALWYGWTHRRFRSKNPEIYR